MQNETRDLYAIFAWDGRFFVSKCTVDKKAKRLSRPTWIGETDTMTEARFIVQTKSTGVIPKDLLWTADEEHTRKYLREVWG